MKMTSWIIENNDYQGTYLWNILLWEKNENTLTNVNVLCVVKIDWCIMFSLFVKILPW